MSRYAIRLMLLTDIAQVANIERQVEFHPWSERQFQESLTAGQRCTVIINSEQVIGFCILQPVLDEANLLLMAIDPKYQGQGCGLMLLEESLALLGEGCVMVFLEVRGSNTPAISLYQKVGFHQMGIRKNYYPADRAVFANGKEDAVLMALTRGNPFG
ncbi:MAG: ribosomal protein S18-alanine N-acetyltransferase [Candidatus Saccharibacteria bacterium]|nr:ribosomal protein S18-alanine N-acetyltransferase [Moraxellaceae bacterium]